MKTVKARMSLLAVVLAFFGFTQASSAIPIQNIPNLTTVTFWEATGPVSPHTFPKLSPQMLNRRTDPLGGGSNFDFLGLSNEFYDVFYSDANGALNINGEYITIEARFSDTTGGGGLNIAEVTLNFSVGPAEYATVLASFVGLGANYQPGSELNAIDANLSTATSMGNTGTSTTDRLRITLGFPSSLGVPVPADLGDAPDSRNHAGTTMFTYAPGVIANFPTVYDPNLKGNNPQGPLHRFPQAFAYLGQSVTFEGEADMGLDADGVTNLDPTGIPPTSDHDLGDDGVTSLQLPDCGLTKLTFSATNMLTGPATAYINVWFDWNRDGDWDDILRCAVAPNIDAVAPEWAVQNYAVTLSHGFNPVLTTPAFRSFNPPPNTPTSPVWMRITLTDVPINAAAHGGPFANPADQGRGGSGPVNGYTYGETEDYLLVGREITRVPSMNEWGLLLAVLAVSLVGIYLYRRRSARA